MRATQADADEVAPAESRRQLHDLLFAAAVAMQKDEERIGVVRLIARRQERFDGQPLRGLHFRSVKALSWSVSSPRKVKVGHENPACAW